MLTLHNRTLSCILNIHSYRIIHRSIHATPRTAHKCHRFGFFSLLFLMLLLLLLLLFVFRLKKHTLCIISNGWILAFYHIFLLWAWKLHPPLNSRCLVWMLKSIFHCALTFAFLAENRNESINESLSSVMWILYFLEGNNGSTIDRRYHYNRAMNEKIPFNNGNSRFENIHLVALLSFPRWRCGFSWWNYTRNQTQKGAKTRRVI